MASRAWLSQQRQRERAEQDAAARALESQREQVEETLAACAALLEAGGGGGAGGAGDAAAAAQCVLARLLDLRTLARCPLPDATKLLAALQPALRRIYSMESMVEAVVCSWGELSSWLLHPGQQRAHQQDASATADAAQLEAQLQQLAQADSHVLGLLVQLLASFVAVTGCNPLQDPPAACAARCTALLVHAALALPTEHDGPEHDDGNHPLLAPAVVGSMLSVLRSGPLAELRLMHAEQQRSPSTATRLPPLLAPSSRHNSLHPPSPPQERPGGPADAEEEGGDGGEGEAHAPYGAQAFGLALSLAQSPCFDALHRLEEQRGAQWGSGSGGIGGGGRRAGSGASRAQLLYRCLAGLVAACCGGLGGSGGAEGGDAGGQRLLGQCLLTSLVGLLPVVAATAQPGAGGGGAGEGGWDEWAETCAGHRVLCALACAPGLPALACALMHATGGSQGRAQGEAARPCSSSGEPSCSLGACSASERCMRLQRLAAGGEAVLQLLRRLHEGQDQAPRLLEVLPFCLCGRLKPRAVVHVCSFRAQDMHLCRAQVLVELLRPESNCALDVRLMALHSERRAAQVVWAPRIPVQGRTMRRGRRTRRPRCACARPVAVMRDAARQRACRGEGEEEEGAGGQVAGVWADGDGGAARTQYVVEVVLFTAMHDASAKCVPGGAQCVLAPFGPRAGPGQSTGRGPLTVGC